MITRIIAIKNLEPYIGQPLAQYAEKYNVTIKNGDKINKGWKGHVLEYLCGLTANNQQAPNGLGFELKSVAFVSKKVKGNAAIAGTLQLTPKETMAITMIKPENLIVTPFYESHCWEKLKSLVFCACEWQGKNSLDGRLLAVKSFDFISSDTLIKEIEADYEDIRQRCLNSGFGSLSGKYGKWIQARTKGQKNTTSRAFYARKELVIKIFEGLNN